MIDFHCHLDLYTNPLDLIDRVANRNEFTLVVTTSPRAFLATSEVLGGRSNIYIALGLHPEIIESKFQEESLFVQLISSAEFIGEIGLDGSSRFKSTLPLQQRIFTNLVAECQIHGGRVISIHSRGAESRILDIIADFPGLGLPILHWFSGSVRELKRAIDLGCWFSVGPAMLVGGKGRNLLSEMPLDRILPETDGPFAQVRGGILMPWDASNVIDVVASIKGLSNAFVAGLLRKNLTNLFAMKARQFRLVV